MAFGGLLSANRIAAFNSDGVPDGVLLAFIEDSVNPPLPCHNR